MVGGQTADLLADIDEYLRAHHVMTVATSDPMSNEPNAATVFYALDDKSRLIFLSQPTSVHGGHIDKRGAVAVTVSEGYEDWRLIKGVQLWGTAHLLKGAAKAGALAVYLQQFPFLRDLVGTPGHSEKLKGIGVYRIEPERVGLTDNTAGVFGRETVDLRVE